VVGELVEILFLFFQVRYGSKLSDGLLKKELEVCGSGGTKKRGLESPSFQSSEDFSCV